VKSERSKRKKDLKDLNSGRGNIKFKKRKTMRNEDSKDWRAGRT